MANMGAEFQFDVFLSHSSKDKAIVRPLAERLHKDGLKVWFDEWEIRPGDSIPTKIEEGLERSRILILCMSANAFGSDWTQLESGTFRFRDPLNRERRFVPLRLDDSPIRASLAQFLYINWSPASREQGYKRILETCQSGEKRERRAPHSACNSGIDPQKYPAEVRSMLFEANRHELHGDFWNAQAKFDEACETLRNSGHCGGEMLLSLVARAGFNRQLGEDFRKGFKGTAEPSLIRVFDNENQYLCSKPKQEVHDTGLLHHSALLLVCFNGHVVFYRRQLPQNYPNKYDFLGGHTADVDTCVSDTARREANEELQLYVHGNRLQIPDYWIHQVGCEHHFVWNAPKDRERSTLFVIEVPSHPGITLHVSDEGADGRTIVCIPDYEVDSLSDILRTYTSREREFAHGAERVLIEIGRDPELRAELAKWFPDILPLNEAPRAHVPT